MVAIGECTKTIKTPEGELTVFSLRELESKGIIKDLSNVDGSATQELEDYFNTAE
jgi:aconitate hydratase